MMAATVPTRVASPDPRAADPGGPLVSPRGGSAGADAFGSLLSSALSAPRSTVGAPAVEPPADLVLPDAGIAGIAVTTSRLGAGANVDAGSGMRDAPVEDDGPTVDAASTVPALPTLPVPAVAAPAAASGAVAPTTTPVQAPRGGSDASSTVAGVLLGSPASVAVPSVAFAVASETTGSTGSQGFSLRGGADPTAGPSTPTVATPPVPAAPGATTVTATTAAATTGSASADAVPSLVATRPDASAGPADMSRPSRSLESQAPAGSTPAAPTTPPTSGAATASVPPAVAPLPVSVGATATATPTGATATAPVPAAPFAAQLSRPLAGLAAAGPGHHVLTLRVSPEHLGPVTVQAHIGADGIRIELFSPTDAGRAAVHAVLADLRRDLAGTGLGASLDLSDRRAPLPDPSTQQGQHGQQHDQPGHRDHADLGPGGRRDGGAMASPTTRAGAADRSPDRDDAGRAVPHVSSSVRLDVIA